MSYFHYSIFIYFNLFIYVLGDKDLQLVHVVYRHGARTPADTYPNDPYVNETFFPVGWGQLTNAGKLYMYENGLFIRERYNNFLGDVYSPRIAHVQSTDSDRTIVSAQLMDAGIWPPSPEQKWGPLDWQPVPVHYEPLASDNLLLVRRPCAQYHLELEKVMSRGHVRRLLLSNQELFNNLTGITGLEIRNFDDVQSLYSTLKAEEGFNLTLPEWTEDYYPDKLLPLTEYSYVVNAYTTKLKRLKGGVLLRKLLVDWFQIENTTSRDLSPLVSLLKSKEWIKEAAAYGGVTNERKLFLYGGHDSTVTNLLSALNIWEMQLPDYGITVLLELLKDTETNQFGIQIFLRNQTDVPPYLLTIPGCGSFCPLRNLLKIVDPIIPRDLVAECKSNDPNYVPPTLGGP